MSESNMVVFGDEWIGGKKWINDKGQPHREDGPAFEWDDGDRWWCINNKFHRTDGPAIDNINGRQEWYYNGVKLNCSTQEEFERLMALELFW